MKRNKEFYEGAKFYMTFNYTDDDFEPEKHCPYDFSTEAALDWMEGLGAAEDLQLFEELNPDELDKLLEDNNA